MPPTYVNDTDAVAIHHFRKRVIAHIELVRDTFNWHPVDYVQDDERADYVDVLRPVFCVWSSHTSPVIASLSSSCVNASLSLVKSSEGK